MPKWLLITYIVLYVIYLAAQIWADFFVAGWEDVDPPDLERDPMWHRVLELVALIVGLTGILLFLNQVPDPIRSLWRPVSVLFAIYQTLSFLLEDMPASYSNFHQQVGYVGGTFLVVPTAVINLEYTWG